MKGRRKTKTSVTLSEDLLAQLDELVDSDTSRSAFIESVLRSFLERRQRARADAHDLTALNQNAGELNAEAAEVREFQAPWPSE